MRNLAHGWRLQADEGSDELVREFIRPALRAVPRAVAGRLGVCLIRLEPSLPNPDAASQWRENGEGCEIVVATGETDPHDVALELLLCLGQALWEKLDHSERSGYLLQLDAEFHSGVTGEINDVACSEKEALLSSRISAISRRRLERYARASFASTAAEYIHAMWHDVTVREGGEHLPAHVVKKRFQMLSRWFPPNRGRRLFGRTTLTLDSDS